MAVWYCQEIIARRVPACEDEVLACRRFLDMKAKAESGNAPYYWSDAHVLDACSFAEKLKHTVGFEGNLRLEPVQCWWFAAIFGFRNKTNDLRWVLEAQLWIPRKNAKSTTAVPIVLFCMLCEGEPGAKAVISAGSEKQAYIPFGLMREAIEAVPEMRQWYQVKHTKEEIVFGRNGASIEIAATRAKNLDGKNPHVLLSEELHSQDQDVIGVLRTAMGARRAPLSLSISTAGRDKNSPAYADFDASRKILRGHLKNDRMFTVVYAGSEEDDSNRFKIETLERLNPLWGISLNPFSIDQEIREAKKSESKLNEYRRTRLNIWVRAAGNLIDVDKWDACADPSLRLTVLRGLPLFVGIDLASRSDLNAAQYLTCVNGCLYAAGDYWLPEGAPRMDDDRFSDQFRKWSREGWMTLTPGGFIDYHAILDRIFERMKGHRVLGVGLDDYQANLMGKEIEDAGYRVFIVPKRAKYITQATDDLISRVQDKALLQHDANPVTRWCASNVVGVYDQNSNVLPKKEKPDSRANIDGIDALIVANALRMDYEAGMLGAKDKSQPLESVYNHRGLAGFDGE